MERIDVMLLMSSSRNADEWDANADKVKAAHGGKYPNYWFEAIIQSGLMRKTLGPGSDEIKISYQ